MAVCVCVCVCVFQRGGPVQEIQSDQHSLGLVMYCESCLHDGVCARVFFHVIVFVCPGEFVSGGGNLTILENV